MAATAAISPHETFSLPNDKSYSPEASRTSTIPRGPVTATLSFYAPPADGSKPFNYVSTPPPNTPQHNFGEEQHDITINDIRGHEGDFNLAKDAFEVFQNVESVASDDDLVADDPQAIEAYYDEVAALIKRHVAGVEAVHIFDHTIRRASTNAPRGPVQRAHIDQTASSARDRVLLHMPDEAQRLLNNRFRIVNIWRPLHGPVESYPLAFCAAHSIADDALVPIEHRYPDRIGETAGVKFTNDQEWWYWSGAGRGERVALLCYDSVLASTGMGRVPHSAFVDPRTDESARPRESIEVRCLVFG